MQVNFDWLKVFFTLLEDDWEEKESFIPKVMLVKVYFRSLAVSEIPEKSKNIQSSMTRILLTWIAQAASYRCSYST